MSALPDDGGGIVGLAKRLFAMGYRRTEKDPFANARQTEILNAVADQTKPVPKN